MLRSTEFRTLYSRVVNLIISLYTLLSMSAYYDLYQTPDPSGEEGKQLLHARILPKGTITAGKFLEIVHNATGFSQAILDGTLQAITDELQRWLEDGWIVEVGELGFFSVSLKCDHYVQDKKDIRSPSIRFQNMNLRISSKLRKRFVTMELERKASPYVSHSSLSEEEKRKRLQLHLEKYGCITRADYEALTGKTKQQAVADLNKFLEEGIIRRYGSGRTVVYLKGGER